MADPRPGVLFDLDGTLVDTNYLHTIAWSRAFADAGEWAPMHAIHRLVGMGGDQLMDQAIGHHSEAASKARAEHYQRLAGEVRAFPGAAELLAALHDRGVLVVLATSAPADEVDTAIEALGGRGPIDAVTTKDDVERSKPAPDLFRAAMATGDVDRRRALAVGDSVWDIQAARASGIGCIGVESGGFSQHELGEEGAVRVYRDVAEVRAQLFTSPFTALLG